MKDKLIGLFLLLMGLIGAGTGAVELKENFATKTPTALTWPQFLEQKPKAGWFKVTGAQLDVPGGMWVEDIISGKMGNIYVPARAAGDESSDDAPIEVLVKVDNPKIAQMVKDLKQLDKGTDEATDEAAINYALSHAEQLIIEKPLVGTIAEGFDTVDSHEESVIRSSGVALADDFVILQENAKPDIGGRVFLLLGGIGVSLLGLFYIFLKKPAPPAATPPASMTPEPPLTPPASPPPSQ